MPTWEMKMPLLDIKNLSVNYSNVSAVAGVSLSVEEGEVVVLIGANGAGKSSVLRALFGLTPSESDVMSLDTMDLRRLSPQQRVLNGMALVPETRELFSGMTIEDNLKLGLFIHKEELSFKKELDRISHLFPILMNRLKQRAGTLSGGEQQMLALARALMQKPRLLCLDEPSLGLAPKLVGDFYALLKKIVEQGVGLLLVEQQARRALAFGMRGYVLNVGEMVKQGSCTELAEDEFVKSAYLGRGTR